MNRIFRKFAFPYVAWMTFFILIPLLMIVFFSFTTTNGSDISNFRFTLENYDKFIDKTYVGILINSFMIAVKTTLITLFLGYPVAYILSKLKNRTKQILLLLVILPMWINMLLRTYSWIAILSRKGILNSILTFLGLPTLNILNTETAVLIGMTYNFLPFMIFPIYTSLSKMDKSLLEASKDLGASWIQTFIRVILPLSIPGILSGIIMVFMPSVSSFVITNYLGGGKVELIGNTIERQFMFSGNWNFGAALSIVLITFILISMAIMNKVDDSGDYYV